MDWLEKEINLLGKGGIDLISKTEVTVFGVGGVGSYAVEILARTGIGTINIVDNDVIDKTNINRQLYALNSTIGHKKIDIAYDRCKDINPDIKINKYDLFIGKEKDIQKIIKNSDYVLDCIDTIPSKVSIIKVASELSISIIASMGTGNKLKPLSFKIRDIYNTKNCPLSKKLRKELRKNNIKSLKVVCSEEEDARINKDDKTISTISFVPSVAGIIMASECIKDVLEKKKRNT